MPPKEVKLYRPIKGKGNTPTKSSPNSKPQIAHRPLTRSIQGSYQEKHIEHHTQESPQPIEKPLEKSKQNQKEGIHSPSTRRSPRKLGTGGSPQPKQIISHRPITRSHLPNLPSSSSSLPSLETANIGFVNVLPMSSTVDGENIMVQSPVVELDSMETDLHGQDSAEVPRASTDTVRASPPIETTDGQDADVPQEETNAASKHAMLHVKFTIFLLHMFF